jgi:hypothetical protein
MPKGLVVVGAFVESCNLGLPFEADSTTMGVSWSFLISGQTATLLMSGSIRLAG